MTVAGDAVVVHEFSLNTAMQWLGMSSEACQGSCDDWEWVLKTVMSHTMTMQDCHGSCEDLVWVSKTFKGRVMTGHGSHRSCGYCAWATKSVTVLVMNVIGYTMTELEFRRLSQVTRRPGMSLKSVKRHAMIGYNLNVSWVILYGFRRQSRVTQVIAWPSTVFKTIAHSFYYPWQCHAQSSHEPWQTSWTHAKSLHDMW